MEAEWLAIGIQSISFMIFFKKGYKVWSSVYIFMVTLNRICHGSRMVSALCFSPTAGDKKAGSILVQPWFEKLTQTETSLSALLIL